MKITQKIQVAVIACLLAVMFVGCTSEPSIVGTWSVQTLDEDESGTIEFKKNGTLIVIDIKTTIRNGRQERRLEGTWTQSGNVIYTACKGHRDVDVLAIKSLNENSLVLQNGDDDDDLLYLKREK